MIAASGITLQYGKRVLFENVNIQFSPGNCYGLIGANGSGKSTFLKILAGDLESSAGQVITPQGARLSILRQDQFAFDEYRVLDTVIMGHQKLHDVIHEKDAIYAKADFSEKDGLRASELESMFAEMNGWEAEAEAGKLLSDLGITEKYHNLLMKEIEASQKVRVLLARALFGNPDILLLDEPTNQLDVETGMWLEEFLSRFENTVIVVSHDRHFLDQVCTHVADIDFGKIMLYPGNYSFWYESSQLALRQRNDQNKRTDEKRKELQEFISRFSANASKSKQATSRKKLLEKLTLEEIKPSNRKYPFVGFKPERDLGNDILLLEDLTASADGTLMFKNLSLRFNRGDKIGLIGPNDKVKTTLFQVLMGELPADSGSFKWGVSTTKAYFPKDNKHYFDVDLNLIDWLRQYSKDTDENFIRGFLGRMLFSGDEPLKQARVLSGGEKVRCMLAKMMLLSGNFLIMDEPTNHLDLESIQALNEGMQKFAGCMLFSTQDHQLMQTAANRIVEITPKGFIDKTHTTLDEYLSSPAIQADRQKLY